MLSRIVEMIVADVIIPICMTKIFLLVCNYGFCDHNYIRNQVGIFLLTDFVVDLRLGRSCFFSSKCMCLFSRCF